MIVQAADGRAEQASPIDIHMRVEITQTSTKAININENGRKDRLDLLANMGLVHLLGVPTHCVTTRELRELHVGAIKRPNAWKELAESLQVRLLKTLGTTLKSEQTHEEKLEFSPTLHDLKAKFEEGERTSGDSNDHHNKLDDN